MRRSPRATLGSRVIVLLLLAVIFVGMAAMILEVLYGPSDAPAEASRRESLLLVAGPALLLTAVLGARALHPGALAATAPRGGPGAWGPPRHDDFQLARPAQPALGALGKRAAGAGGPFPRHGARGHSRTGWRLAALFGCPETAGQTRIIAILAQDERGELGALAPWWFPAPIHHSRRNAPRPTCSSAKSPNNAAWCPRGIPGSSRCGATRRITRRRRARRRRGPGRVPVLPGRMARRCTRWRWARSTPASSSPGTSGSRRTARRCCSSRSCWDSSTAGWSACWRLGGGRTPSCSRSRSRVIRSSATRAPPAAPSRPWPGAGRRLARRRSAASPSNSNASPTTSAISAPSRAT